MQLVTLTDAKAKFSAGGHAATMGDQSVTLTRLSDTAVILLVPPLSPGSYALTSTIDGIAYTATLKVDASQVVPDPISYVTPLLQAELDDTDALRSSVLGPRLAAVLDATTANLHDLQTQFAAMSPEQQAAMAMTIASNPKLFAPNVAQVSLDALVGKLQQDLPFLAASVTGAAAAGSLIGGPVGLVVGAGAAFIFGISKAYKSVARDEADIANQTFQNIQTFPQDTSGDTSSPQFHSGAPVPAARATLEFPANVEALFNLTGPFERLSSDDLSSIDPGVKMLATEYQAAVEQQLAANSLVVHSFGSPPALEQRQVMTMPIDPTLVTIGNVVGTGVSLQSASPSGSALAVTFSGVEGTSFTFDVVYDDGFTMKQTIPFQAMLAPPCGAELQPCCSGVMCASSAANPLVCDQVNNVCRRCGRERLRGSTRASTGRAALPNKAARRAIA